MAQFILGSKFGRKAHANSVLRHALWFVDLVVVGAVLIAFRILPVTWASGIGARLGRVLGRCLKRRSRTVRDNLSAALPERSPEEIDRLVGEVWANAGAVLAEYPHLGQIGDPRRDFIEFDVDERAAACVGPQRPVVYVAAHLGNWEVACAAMTQMGIRSYALYAPLSNPWFDKLLLRYRRRLGCETVSREEGMRSFINALKAGDAPAMIIDRKVDKGTPIPFFGRDKPSSTLPARLALRFDVPLVPVRVVRLPGARFRVHFYAPLETTRPEADAESRALDLTRQIHASFEAWIRAQPGEWLCTSKIWPSSVLAAKSDIYRNKRRAAE